MGVPGRCSGRQGADENQTAKMCATWLLYNLLILHGKNYMFLLSIDKKLHGELSIFRKKS